MAKKVSPGEISIGPEEIVCVAELPERIHFKLLSLVMFGLVVEPWSRKRNKCGGNTRVELCPYQPRELNSPATATLDNRELRTSERGERESVTQMIAVARHHVQYGAASGDLDRGAAVSSEPKPSTRTVRAREEP